MLLLALVATQFDPVRFFTGHTEGTGRLRVALHRTRTVRVQGEGRPTQDGIVLRQRVEQEGSAPRTRRWVLHRVAPGHYAGTLTDAHGPVTVESVGDRLHIAYRAGGKVRIEQWLILAPDGRSAQNRLTAKRFGVTLARLDETIRRTE